MKQMNKLGLGAKLGAKAKRETLTGLSDDGTLAPDAGGGGLFGGLGGGLGGLFGGGGGGGDAGAGMPDLEGLMGGARPMGSSSTRKSGSKRKDKKKDKRKKSRKGRRK